MRNLKKLLPVFLLVMLPAFLFAQESTISGRVIDAAGAPLFGVSVMVKETNRGTSTDAEGRFKLSVPPNATLVISSTGLKWQTIHLKSTDSDLQIKLEEDVARLEEVVVTGLATNIKRRNLSNAVATISSKQLQGIA